MPTKTSLVLLGLNKSLATPPKPPAVLDITAAAIASPEPDWLSGGIRRAVDSYRAGITNAINVLAISAYTATRDRIRQLSHRSRREFNVVTLPPSIRFSVDVAGKSFSGNSGTGCRAG